MKVLITNYQTRAVKTSVLKRTALAAMQAEGCPENAMLSIVLCGDRRIRTLNREWRGKDSPTDVLSFSQLEPKKGRRCGGRKEIPGEPQLLGDVVISVQTAAKQAGRAGHSLHEELRFLLVHGVLHLLGWEDETEAQLKRMVKRQKEILKAA